MNTATKNMTTLGPIVLAFSGGLDTSYCVLELKAQGYDVHTVFVDTGGLTLRRGGMDRRSRLIPGCKQASPGRCQPVDLG